MLPKLQPKLPSKQLFYNFSFFNTFFVLDGNSDHNFNNKIALFLFTTIKTMIKPFTIINIKTSTTSMIILLKPKKYMKKIS
jgi:hypothetical protein